MKPPIQQSDTSTSDAVVPLTDRSVSEDPRTATATLLPPRLEEKPAFEWSTALLANGGAGPNARLRARPWLRTGHWRGNTDIATRVADKLVDNAVRHGGPFNDGCVSLHLIVSEDTRELLVEVDDANPEFPDFEKVANLSGEPDGRPTGLWWVAHYRGRMSWDVKRDVDGTVVGKTVQAILPLT